MKFVGDLKKSPSWLVATFLTVAICSLSTSIHRHGMPTIPEELLDTSSSSLSSSSSTTTATTTSEGIAETNARRLREQSARLAKYRDNAALEREHQRHQHQHQQQQLNNNDSTAHRSLHSRYHQGGGGGGGRYYRGGGGYYRQYNGYGGKKGKGGKGKGGKQYYDGITAKGQGNGQKYCNWKPTKGKGYHYGKGKGTT
jgi:hypothetical protein